MRFPIRSGISSALTHRVHAVEQIDFTLWPGETLSIVGESGCALMRLVDSDANSILFAGREIASLKEAQLRLHPVGTGPFTFVEWAAR